MTDYVEVGGSEGLDTRHLALADSICGLDSRPGEKSNQLNWFTRAVTTA
jgi:hypothetical protein